MQDQILAALKKRGAPMKPGDLAAALDVTTKTLRTHIAPLLEEGAVKAAGKTAGRFYGLPDMAFAAAESAPPQLRKPKKHAAKGKHKAKRRAKAQRASARPAAAPAQAERFLATVDVNCNLVIVTGAIHVFTEEQTEQIATLLFNHWKE